MYKVSVIVPVYNGEKYIDECLQSIQNQVLKEIEIICIDDGSTDATANILDKYAKQDIRLKVLHKNNTGYGNSLNIGFAMAKGEYIGVVESDDYIDENMYLHLYKRAKENNLDFVKADFRVFYGDGNNRKLVYRSLFENILDKDIYNKIVSYKEDVRILNNYVVTWAGIYKREFIEKNFICHNETPGASYQDNGFWYQVMINAKKALFLDQPYYFVRRDNEDSSIYNQNKIFCTNEEYEFVRSYIRKQGNHTEKLLQFQWKTLFAIHENDMMRISKEFYKAFTKRFRSEFIMAIKENEFDMEELSKEQQTRLKTLLDSPKAYVEKYFHLGSDSKNRIEKAERIAIYGGKWNGRRILSILKNHGYSDKVIGIIVSDLKGKEEVINNFFLKELKDFKSEPDTLFILATQEKYQLEIIMKLAEHGYENWIKGQDIIK